MSSNLPRLSAKHIGFYYKNRQILKDINLSLNAGEYLSIIGPNGSGKSTLFKILCGLLPPKQGLVHYEGNILHKMDFRYRGKCIAMVHQNSAQAIPFSCLESILLGLHPHLGRFDSISNAQYKRIQQLMELTDTWKLSEQPITQLSGGERQRVALCRALVQEPKLLLLDEAMSELDISARMQISNLLKTLCADTGLTVLAIHHDLNLAYRISDTLYALKDGICYGFGKPEEVMTEEMFQTVFQVKAEIIENKGFFIQNILK